MTRPTIPDVADRFRAYHGQHPTWGSLHVVLDDGNVADYFVEACVDFAREEGDNEGAELALILLAMGRTQRLRIGRTL